MPVTTPRTSRRSVVAVGRFGQSRQRPRRRQRLKQQSAEEAAGRCERLLRERVTYLLWVMAQTLD